MKLAWKQKHWIMKQDWGPRYKPTHKDAKYSLKKILSTNGAGETRYLGVE